MKNLLLLITITLLATSCQKSVIKKNKYHIECYSLDGKEKEINVIQYTGRRQDLTYRKVFISTAINEDINIVEETSEVQTHSIGDYRLIIQSNNFNIDTILTNQIYTYNFTFINK